MPHLLLIAAASYLLGSIPFGYLLVRMFRGEDIRQSGSGNIGATNVSRKSPALGVFTLMLDAAKGFCAVQLAIAISQFPANDPRLFRVMAAAALLAIAGHMFPLWLRFRGGKGVATALGAFLHVSPLTVLIAMIIFIVVVLATRIISLGSVITAAAFPIVMWYANPVRDAVAIALVAAASALVIARHQQNIRRLISGGEPRFALRKK
jgi:glycerol-3-phosphate acyltransferase PlsY